MKSPLPRTLKLQGMVKWVSILLLVDSGATHNFMSRKLAEKIGWKIIETKPLIIKLGDGHRAEAQGKCVGMELELGRHKVKLDAILFDLEGINVVLGMSWLACLRGMWVDWEKQIMLVQL